jgi:cell fate regulator YaaT (PSP1 superfamily)
VADIIQVALRGSRKGFFLNSRGLILQLRDRVIVQTDHGEALGSIFLKDPRLIELKRPTNVTREIIRKATEEDLDQEDHNREKEEEAFEYCRDRIVARGLLMELAEVEVAFNGHRMTFYFSADQRVDFRELVKDLASRFRTRIELRQIGRREQAKRLDGCGPCGRPLCCSTWLKEFHPVTLKMAREQQLSLNPTKISGACGRLMCCLAYELDSYRQSAEKLPPVGTTFKTGQGPMTVVRTAFFEEAVWVRDDDGAEHRIAYADMPPGPYRQCGDCGCGKKGKGGNGNGGGKGHDGGTAHDGGNGPDEPTDPPIEGDSV